MKKFKQWIVLFFILLLLPIGIAKAQNSTITDLRWKARNDGNPPFVRIVMDLSNKVRAEASLDKEGHHLKVLLKNTDKGAIQSNYQMDPKTINSISIEQQGNDVCINAALTHAHVISSSDVKIFGLKPDSKNNKPHRIVIDIPAVSVKPTSNTKSTKVDTATVTATATMPKSFSVTEKDKNALKGKTITIDPGHGGSDTGAIGHLNDKEYYEKDITLSISKILQDMLKSAGAKVIMTRTTDKDVYAPFADGVTELQTRCDIANKAKSDVFICVHIDSFVNETVDGTTTYYYPMFDQDLLLAHMIHQSTIDNLSIPDRGVRSSGFYVNMHTTMPSILVELGFISNPHRLKMLTSNWGPGSIAKSLYDGLVNYFEAV
mgnify:FL=1